MKATVTLSQTDYMTIARMVADGTTDEPSTYEVVYTAGGYTLFLDVTHEFEAKTVRGGSYEGYDFERITEVENEFYDVVGFECHDDDGEPVACDFTAKRLLDILN